jgi:polyamine oxidase
MGELAHLLYICTLGWLSDSLQGNNFTYDADQGGFSDSNLMSIDQRGFKSLIQDEAKTFLKPAQLRLDSVVKTIHYNNTGVTVVLENNQTLSGDYAISTFSLGVLQHDDVKFSPPLPGE